MVTSNFEKFRLLLWKNWILQWNSKSQFVFELLLPVLFSMLVVFVRMLVSPEFIGVTIYTKSFPIDNLNLLKEFLNSNNNLTYHLAYSPNTSQIFEKIVKEAAGSLSLTYSGYVNSRTLEDGLRKSNYLAGVEFEDSMATIMKYPEQLNYRLRFPSTLRTGDNKVFTSWMTNYRYPRLDPVGPRNIWNQDGGIPAGYLREGFLAVQNAISTAFIKQSANLVGSLPRVFLQRFPYPAHVTDFLMGGLTQMIGVIIMLSYLYPCTHTVKSITAEKEKQLKEVMKIMGLPNWLHWMAWFVKVFLMMSLSGLLIVTIFMIKWKDNVAVLTYSSFTAVYFFFLIYIMTSVTLCFMLATFFSNANTAAALTGVIWFVMYIPFTVLLRSYDDLTLFQKIFWCLISNTGIGLGFRIIIGAESEGEGLQWNNMFKQANVDDTLSLGHVIGMMLLTCVIHMVICLYVEQIYPGDYGVPKKWNFPFEKSFWYGKRQYIAKQESSHEIKRDNTDAFEEEPIGKTIGLQVKNLTKKFGYRKAVNNISLNMYEDEITVLLGHNGAGKTTTISMLIGMIPPTSGTAIINGYDIRTNLDGARTSLSICPQHNILFDDLTVRDHLVFYGCLRGLKGAELEAEVKNYIKKTDLEKKANVASSKLSGGMKRRLSVCAAFCGGAKVVLCDEPSSGLDPSARRQLWDLLQSEKIGRTVLLTTHFMDEAEVLGDRIAIMSAGKLKCFGTSFFLKKKFGSGYHLICVKKDNCNSTNVTRLLSKYIPGIQPESEIGSELSYLLPNEFSSRFEKMLQDLETNSDELKLNGYGISLTSLEEVFLKVGAAGSGGRRGSAQKHIGEFGSEDGKLMSFQKIFSDNRRLLKGAKLMYSQWHSMILKKYLYTIRNKILFVIQNTVTIIFISLTIYIAKDSNYAPLKPMFLDLIQFPITVTVLETAPNVKIGSIESKIIQNYKEVVRGYGHNHRLQQTGSLKFIDYILELGKIDQIVINRRYIAAATVRDGSITAWLNNKPFHTAPVTVNLIHNAMARALIGPNASIKVTNAPLPFTAEMVFKLLNSVRNAGTQIAMNVGFGMSFVSALYVIFLVREHQNRAKLLQFVSGVRVLTFWLSHFIWDMFTFVISTMAVISTLRYYDQEGYSTPDELGRYLVILLTFGYSVLPLTYLIAGLFTEPSTGFSRLATLNMFTGNALFIMVLIMRNKAFDLDPEADFSEQFFLIFPHFALSQGMHELFKNGQIIKHCKDFENIPKEIVCEHIPKCCILTPYFAWESPGVLRILTYLIVTGNVFFLTLIIKEYRLMESIWFKIKQRKIRTAPPPEDGYFDEDVEHEKERVRNMSSSDISEQNLVLDRLTKFYGTFVAVNQISVAVSRSECFGLLGVNGAGKTSTFKMLTGDVIISSGEAYVKGLSLKSDMNLVYKEIGYCPQFDALFEDFTGREMLKIFCLLRGIPKKKISRVSTDLAKSFGFMQHYKKQVRAYSGGNKRKLSTAVAVVGSPSVVYLDEPTSGMDAGARRQLWNVVSRIRDAGKTIILTSHSMEECEALCTRLAIMVNGELKAIGSSQHLKNRFTKGLILKLKMKKDTDLTRNLTDKDTPMNIMEFIEKEFPEAFLQERYQGILTFYIPISSVSWSRIFGLMERNKAALNIEDYSISQTTLEEIFLQFAKYQREDSRDTKSHGLFKKFVKWVRAKM